MADTQSLSRALGSRLKSHRKGAHLDQASVALRVGLSRASVSNIENGRQPVTLQTLWRFAQALQVPLKELVPDDAEVLNIAKKPASEIERSWVKRIEAADVHT